MKENFEEALHVIKDVAEKVSETSEALGATSSALEDAGLEEMIPEAGRLSVLELQKEKQEVMDWLHKNIEAIEKGEGVESLDHSGDLYVINKDLQTEEAGALTLGEILTDGEWGIRYKLLSDVPRDIKKRFIVSEAKRHILKLLDKQISTAEVKREIPKWIDGPMRDYMHGINACYNSVLSPGYEKSHTSESGFIAEKLVSTFMEGFQIDNSSPYKLSRGDAFDDFERKIDFYIHIPLHTRGVKSYMEERDDVGIQFTVNPGKKREEHKLEQIETAKRQFGLNDIDDIVLVSISLKHSEGCYKRWVQKGRKPGGPARYLPEAMKEEIFFGVLEKFFEEDTVLKMWDERRLPLGQEKRTTPPTKWSRTAVLRDEVRRWWLINGPLVDKFPVDELKAGRKNENEEDAEESSSLKKKNSGSSWLRGFWKES